MTTPVNGSNEIRISETEVKQCPCHSFRTSQDIRRAFDSNDRTRDLVEWLSRKSSGPCSFRQLSCQKDSTVSHGCAQRVSSAFIVLNAIRDACRHHLESSSFKEDKNDFASQTYTEAFPALGGTDSTPSGIAPTVLVGRKKSSFNAGQSETPGKEKAKSKRRIRPAPATEGEPASPAWMPSLTQSQSSIGNISTLPSENPISLKDKGPPFKGTLVTNQNKIAKNVVKRIAPTPLSHSAAATLPDKGAWSVVGTTKEKISNLSIQGSKTGQINRNFKPIKPAKVWTARNERNTDDGGGGEKEHSVLQELDGVKGGCLESGKETTKTGPRTLEKQLQNLIKVYTTTLQHHLVPSTALELHLLIRLLTVQEDSNIPVDENSPDSFSSLFPTGKECKTFAILVLRRHKRVLRNLGFHLVKALSECPPFRELLPEVATELHSIAERIRNAAVLSGVDNVSNSVGDTQTPMLTLPFDQQRDSRHNYRSTEASGLYKNREESRDAFLYQLRAFQNVRERVLDAVHADRSLQNIRLASRDVVSGIFDANMFWFAEMFCDLLLQIGLVPMEETDKELLNITDKDKLQKLHRRFSSKHGKTNNSSHKLVLEPKNPMGTLSSAAEPQQCFPGHQEFFFLFIKSADSYSFGMHLRRRLAGMLSKLAAVDDIKTLEERLLKMQLLARFLGALVFSPNWYGLQQGANRMTPAKSEDAVFILNLEQHVLPFDRFVKTARMERRLFQVVPWVVEFLRMLQWDNVTQRTSYYRHLFGLLRAIQEEIEGEGSEAFSAFQSNMQLVSFYLESLFCNVVGLGKRSLLPSVELPKLEKDTTQRIDQGENDAYVLIFRKNIFFASNSHLEELLSLVTSLKEPKRKTGSDVGISPRKMRPYALSGSTADISSLTFRDSYNSELPGAVEQAVTALSFDSPYESREGGTSAIQRKLVDAFFHQHKDLKELCNIAVERTLKNMPLILPKHCIIPTIEKGLAPSSNASEASSAESFRNALHGVAQDALVESRSVLRKSLEEAIRETLRVLGPPSMHRVVAEVALSVSVSRAVRSGETVILALVREEVKKKGDAHTRIEKQQPNLSGGDYHVQQQTPLEETVDSLNRFADVLLDYHSSNVEPSSILDCVLDAKNSLDSWISLRESGTNEGNCKPLYSTVTKLDPFGPCVVFHLESCLLQSSNTEEPCRSVAFELIELVVYLSKARLCRRVVRSVTDFFSNGKQLERLMIFALESRINLTETKLIQLLLDMVNAELIHKVQLETAVLYVMNELDSQLATEILTKCGET